MSSASASQSPRSPTHCLPATPTTASSGMTLDERVQKLPPELFCRIYDFTMVIEPNRPSINWNYKSPVQLQIDRRSRAIAAKQYYGKGVSTIDSTQQNSDFITSKNMLRFFGHKICLAWMGAIDPQHRSLITKFSVFIGADDQVAMENCIGDWTDGWSDPFSRVLSSPWTVVLRKCMANDTKEQLDIRVKAVKKDVIEYMQKKRPRHLEL